MSVQSSPNSAKIVALEVGRSIVQDVKQMLGEPVAVISYQRPVTEEGVPKTASEVYRVVAKAASGGHEVHPVLLGPVALAFQIGHLVGLGHCKAVVYQFSGWRYRPAPPVTREVMFGD